MTQGGSSLRGTALAALVAAGSLLVQDRCARDPRLVYSRFDLPAFDAYVYVAMAEDPRVFTVAPWGYRVLTPALAHAAARGEPARVLRGFRLVNAAALLAAALLLWRLARRVGLAPWAALAAVPLFLLSPPVAELVRNPFLADALAVALAAALLLALESGASWPVLALVALLGVLAKESFLLLLPVVYLARRRRDAERSALASAAATMAAAGALTVLLRAWWTPHLETPVPAAALDTLSAAAANLHMVVSRQHWAAVSVLVAVAAAFVASRRADGRSLLARYGYAALVAVLAPFFNPVVFSPGDVRRLAVHALPVLVLVVLAALPGAWGTALVPPPAASRGRRLLTGLAAAAVLVSPLALDRYRRADLQGPRDGPYILAFCRETLRTARRLQRGDTATFDMSEREFQWGVSDPGRLDRMRWFLRAGWGPLPHYSAGEPALRGQRAELIVPAPAPQPLFLRLHLDATGEAAGTLLVNGHAVGQWRAPGEQSWRLPAEALFRGDNVVTLDGAPAGGEVRLRRFTVAPAGP